MDLEEIRNPFPSPPSFYTHFTSYNLKLRDLWLERSSGNEQESQHELLSEFTDVPDWPLSSLQPPRVDWILDEGTCLLPVIIFVVFLDCPYWLIALFVTVAWPARPISSCRAPTSRASCLTCFFL